MALTVSDISKIVTSDRGRTPDIRISVKDVTADAAYPAGGYTLTPSWFGLTTIVAVIACPTPDGAHVAWDPVAGKLKFLVSGGSGAKASEASGAGVSGSVARLLVFGL